MNLELKRAIEAQWPQKISKKKLQAQQIIGRLTLFVVLEKKRPLAGVEGRSGSLGLDNIVLLGCRLLDDRDFLRHLDC